MNNSIKKQILLHTFKNPESASIFIDTNTVIENYKKILKNAPKNFALTFPVKSCPNKEFIRSISPFLAGFEISNKNELSLIEEISSPDQVVLISNAFKIINNNNDNNFIFDLGYLEQLHLTHSYSQLSLRVQPALKLEQAQKSRFGLTLEEIQEIIKDNKISSKITQVHFHIGFEKTTINDLLDSIESCIELIQSQLTSVTTINIGGGVNGLCSTDFETLFDFIKKLPYKFILEAGRYFFKDSSYAVGKALSIRQRQDCTHILTNLSHESHLKWSWSSKFFVLSKSQEPAKNISGTIKFFGLTAYEDDCILISQVKNSLPISVGDYIVFDNISGYSIAWNHDFNGIGLANVILL